MEHETTAWAGLDHASPRILGRALAIPSRHGGPVLVFLAFAFALRGVVPATVGFAASAASPGTRTRIGRGGRSAASREQRRGILLDWWPASVPPTGEWSELRGTWGRGAAAESWRLRRELLIEATVSIKTRV